MLDEYGIYREPSKKTLTPKRHFQRKKGTIAGWPHQRRAEMERELLACRLTRQQIADKYGISRPMLMKYYESVLQPAVRAAEQQSDIDERNQARKHLDWLYAEGRDSIEKLKYGEQVLDEGGNPVIGEDGRPKVVMGDPKVHGTVSQLIQSVRPVVEKIGEVTGEFGPRESDQPRVIKIITIPKIGETYVEMPPVRQLPRVPDGMDEDEQPEEPTPA